VRATELAEDVLGPAGLPLGVAVADSWVPPVAADRERLHEESSRSAESAAVNASPTIPCRRIGEGYLPTLVV
jgi:hypothetical protein